MAMTLKLIPFRNKDLQSRQGLNSDVAHWFQLLHNRPPKRLFVSTLAYGDRVWTDGKLNVGEEAGEKLDKPIGLVLAGALEVTEAFGNGGHQRVRTTKILQPGDFFGLFEAFGTLCG